MTRILLLLDVFEHNCNFDVVLSFHGWELVSDF